MYKAEDGIRDYDVTGVQTCAVQISNRNKLTFELAAGVDAQAFRLFDSESPLSLSATDASGAEFLAAPPRISHPAHDVPAGRHRMSVVYRNALDLCARRIL